MLRVLFVGDVYGKPGRRVLSDHLQAIRPNFDFVIVNGENAAGGYGLHRGAADAILHAGADCITLGNHAWHHRDIYALMLDETSYPIVRPLNYADPGTPGLGWRTFSTKKDGETQNITVVNLLGRVFMEAVGNPFQALDELLLQPGLGYVIVDMHAEATSEKAALAWHFDGRVAAVLGTHTHVPTADTRILPRGTAFQTDIGFTGPINSINGADFQGPIQKFLTERPHRFTVASGQAELNAVIMQLDMGRVMSIERYRYVEGGL